MRIADIALLCDGHVDGALEGEYLLDWTCVDGCDVVGELGPEGAYLHVRGTRYPSIGSATVSASSATSSTRPNAELASAPARVVIRLLSAARPASAILGCAMAR